MPNMKENAFEQLLEYEDRAKQAVLHSSNNSQLADTLSYILFTIDSMIVAVDISTISDVVKLPKYTKFPSTEKWIVGFSNIKGVPITMVDFGLLLGKRSSAGTKSQALVLQNEYWLSALVVEHVIGIRHVNQSECVALSQDDDNLLNCTHKILVPGMESETVFVLNLENVLQAHINDI